MIPKSCLQCNSFDSLFTVFAVKVILASGEGGVFVRGLWLDCPCANGSKKSVERIVDSLYIESSWLLQCLSHVYDAVNAANNIANPQRIY